MDVSRRDFLGTSIIGISSFIFGPKMSFASSEVKKELTMNYTAREFPKCLGMEGFSENLIKNHFTLYQGYVANTNKLIEATNQMLKEGKANTPEFAELKRRLGWEFNGMRLHEYYFENLGGKGALKPEGKLMKALKASFGSYDDWQKEFKAMAAMRGIGWVILYQDLTNGRLINLWINEHDVGHVAGLNPVLILDLFEHAYMIDYGLKKADYVEAFFKNIDWKIVESRLR